MKEDIYNYTTLAQVLNDNAGGGVFLRLARNGQLLLQDPDAVADREDDLAVHSGQEPGRDPEDARVAYDTVT